MTANTNLSISISVNDAQAKQGIDSVSKGFDGLNGKIANIERSSTALTNSISRMGHAAAAFAAIDFSASGLTQAADAWNSLNAQLKIATGSAKAGAEAYGDVVKIAMQSGQAIGEVGNVYKRFADNATLLGLSQKDVAAATTSVAQAVALSGGTATSAQAALVQFGQALASGTLRGEELNSVMEQSPRLAKAIADGLGVPIGKLRELAEQGKITSDEIVKALSGQASRIDAEFAQLPVTISRAMNNVKTAFTDTVGSFEKSSGAFSAAAKGLDGIAQSMDAIAAAGGVAAAVMTGKAANAFVAAVSGSIASANATRALAAAELESAVATQAKAAALVQSTAMMNTNSAATTALAAANGRLALAQTGVATASRGAMIIGALGGPIGIITTALGLGITAWAMWGSKAESATQEAAKSAAQNLDSIITKITEMNSRLDQVTRKSYDASIKSAQEAITEGAKEASRTRTEIERLNTKNGGRITKEEIALETQLTAILEKDKTLQKELGEAREKSAQVGTAALNKFIDANAVGADAVRVKQAKILQEFAQGIAQTGGIFDAGNSAHVAALKSLNAALDDAAKTKKATGTTAKNDAAQIFAAEIKMAQDAAKTQVEIIQEKVKQGVLAEREGIEQMLAAQNDGFVAQAAALKSQLAKTSDSGERKKLQQEIIALGNDAAVAAEKAATSFKKIEDATLKAKQDYMKGLGDETASLIAKADAAEFEISQIGLTAEQLAVLTAKRYDEAIAIQQVEADRLRSVPGSEAELSLIEAKINALERLKGAEIAKPKLAAQAKEWEKFTDEINRSLTDALMRGFESGKSFGKNFIDSLKNSLKTAGLRVVINAVTNSAGSLVGSAANAVLGTSFGSGSSGGGAGGLVSDAQSVYSLGSKAYGLYERGLDGTVGDTISGVGNLVGDSSISAYGAGYASGLDGVSGSIAAYNTAASEALALGKTAEALEYSNVAANLSQGAQGTLPGGFGGTLGTVAGVAGAGLTAYGVGSAVAGKYGTAAGTAAGTLAGVGTYAVGSSIAASVAAGTGVAGGLGAGALYGSLASIGPVGWIAAGVVALAGALGSGGGKKVATGITSLRGGFVDTGDSETEGFIGQSGMEYKKKGKTSVEWSAVDAQLNDDLSNMYKSVKSGLIATGKIFEDYSLEDKAKGFFMLVDVANSNNMQGVFDVLTEQVTQGLGERMFPSIGALVKEGETRWSQVFARVLAETAAVGGVFDLLGKDIKEIFGTGNADLVLRLSDNFVQLFGSIEGMNQSVGAYYANFYTAAEKTDFAWEKMEQAFEGIGQTMPTTRQGFRDLADSLDLSTDAGQAAFKGLMNLQAGFAALTPSIDDAAKAAADAAAALVANAKAQRDSLLEKFTTPEQSLSAAQTKVTETFEELKIKVPVDGSAFYDLAKGADVSTEAGRKLIEALSGVADAFVLTQEAAAKYAAEQTEKFGQVTSARTGILNQIFESQMVDMTSAAQAAALKLKEGSLWELLEGGDVSVVDELSATLLRRISLESEASKAAADAAAGLVQTMKAARDYAVDMHNQVLSLKAGDLSSLGYLEQLGASETLWQETLAKAQSGDTKAQSSLSGVAREYLQEARGYYGANADYASRFSAVTGALDAFSTTAPTDSQIIKQEDFANNLKLSVSRGGEQVEQLKKIDAVLAKQQETFDAQIVQNAAIAEATIARLQGIIDQVTALNGNLSKAALV